MIPTVEMIDAGWKAGLGLNKLQVERILVAALAAMHAPAVRVLAEKDRRIADLEGERYKLAYAITGGEDAPGLLDTIDVDGLVKMLRNDFASHMEAIDRATFAESEAGRLRTLLAEARKVVEPFAKFAVLAEGFVQARAEQGGSPILPTKHFRVADFRAARALAEKLEKNDDPACGQSVDKSS